MDLSQVEQLVLASQQGDFKEAALAQLHSLREHVDCSTIGWQLFFQASSPDAKFFGLSLVRQYLLSVAKKPVTDTVSHEKRLQSRDTVVQWLEQSLKHLCDGTASNTSNTLSISEPQYAPNYVQTTMTSILVLLIKTEYPERWPTAFDFVLHLGQSYGRPGVEFVVRVLTELTIEVVGWSESRSQEEVGHNTVIKDCMRETPVVAELIRFLCQKASSLAATGQADNELAGTTCLLCLAEMIGWVDLNLVIVEAFPTVVGALSSPNIKFQHAALCCLYELAHKGMDSLAKVELFERIGFVDVLVNHIKCSDFLGCSQMAYDEYEDVENNAGAISIGPLTVAEHLYHVHRQKAIVVAEVVSELVGAWSKFEDSLLPPAVAQKKITSFGGKHMGPSTIIPAQNAAQVPNFSAVEPVLLSAAPVIAKQLHSVMMEMLSLLHHPNVFVAAKLMPCATKLVNLMKTQSSHEAALVTLKSQPDTSYFFIASEYLNQLLVVIHFQSQYPEAMRFEDINEDEENDFVEAKIEARKVFVNVCRVYPERCVELLGAALAQLPQPLNTAKFSSLEASLRLLYAFSESGAVIGPEFAALLQAIHTAGTANHPHLQVLLGYYQISVRYLRLLQPVEMVYETARQLITLIGAMGDMASKKYYQKMRGRFVALLVKLCESLEGNSYFLLNVLGSTIPEILAKDVEHREQGLLQPRSGLKYNVFVGNSEAQLYEVLAMVTTSSPTSPGGGATTNALGLVGCPAGYNEASLADAQFRVFRQAVGFVMAKLVSLCDALAAAQITPDMVDILLPSYLDALSSLIRHVTPAALLLYGAEVESVGSVICKYSEIIVSLSQSSASLTQFFHHWVSLAGVKCLASISPSIMIMLRRSRSVSDINPITALLNQIVCELKEKAFECISGFFGAVLSQIHSIIVDNILGESKMLNRENELFEALKVMFLFMVYLTQHRLDACLYTISVSSSMNVFSNPNCGWSSAALAASSPEDTYLSQVLDLLMAVFKGQPYGLCLSGSSSVTMKKMSCSVVVNLAESMVFHAPWSVRVLKEGESRLVIDPNLESAARARISSFIFDQWLPLLFCATGPPKSLGGNRSLYASMFGMSDDEYKLISLSAKDAATQGVLGEAAALLWQLHRTGVVVEEGVVTPKNGGQITLHQLTQNCMTSKSSPFFMYLCSLFERLHWPEELVMSMLQLFQPLSSGVVPLGTFKEAFKTFARSNLG